ncbi:hypothetical protein FNH22_31265, partial [Fulvivirga sp. M361]|uniref:Ig-like domain-containing protein n=1 Tax=Fulvivirga sp. M361 TaxID=2594266 RepID=UPI00117BD600
MKKSLLLIITLACFFHISHSQVFSSTSGDGDLVVQWRVINACNGAEDGLVEFIVLSSNGNEDATLQSFFDPSPGDFEGLTTLPFNVPVIVDGSNAPAGLPDATYVFFINTPSGDAISSSVVVDDVTTLPTITTNTPPTDLINDNINCNPLDAQINVSLSGGSNGIAGLPNQVQNGFLNWEISTDNALGTISGNTLVSSTLDFASLFSISALPRGEYVFTVSDSFSTCPDASRSYTVTEPRPNNFTISTLTDPICNGDDIIITLDNTDLSVNYTLAVDGVATAITAVGTGGSLDFAPLSSSSYTSNVDISVLASIGFCTDVASDNILQVTVLPFAPDATNPIDSDYCFGDPISNVSVDDPGAGFTVNWYDASSNGNLVGTGATLNPPPSPGTYFAEVVNNATTCVSENRVAATVTEQPIATVSAGPDQTICSDGTVTLSGTIGGSATSSTWSSSGDGTFDDASLLGAVYTPGATDITNGTVDLTLTTDDPAGSCPFATDFMTVTIELAATVSAGLDQTICSDGTVTLSGTIGGSATSSTWSSSGDGSFDDASLLGAVYTPGATDITNGTVDLTLTTDDPAGICPLVFETITLTIDNAPSTFNVTGGATLCDGDVTVIGLDGSQAGIRYDLLRDGVFVESLNGNGSPLDFTAVGLAGTYTVEGINITTTCTISMIGNAVVTVTPILGDPAIFGNETWIGYIYDESDNGGLPGGVGFALSDYRGFITETEIDAFNAQSSYDVTDDVFDLNIGNVAIAAAALCDTYANRFSVRYRMRKTFTQGEYTITIGADDGSRFFLDGALIPASDQFVNGTYSTTTFVACLDGSHDMVIEYYENGGNSRLSFDYTFSPVATPAVSLAVDQNPICAGSEAVFTATPVNGGITPTFQWVVNSAIVPGELTSEFRSSTLSDGDEVFVQMTPGGVFCFSGAPATSSSITMNVLNAATITVPVATVDVCETGGIVDLTTLVSGSPSSGTFSFTGTGVTGNDFDPTGISGIVNILVDYNSGGCVAPTANFDINVITTASITAPASPVTVCESSGTLDLTTLVSATPIGGTFGFSGVGVTGTSFDPAGQSGLITITVNYGVGACVAPVANFEIDVTSDPSLTVPGIVTDVCEADGVVNLTGLVTGSPLGGVFNFSGTGVAGTDFDPSGLSGSITITADYSLGGCTTLPETFDLNVISTPTITVPATPTDVCETGGVVDLTTLVSGSPAGGTFSFTGTGVTGNDFDPTGLSGS